MGPLASTCTPSRSQLFPHPLFLGLTLPLQFLFIWLPRACTFLFLSFFLFFSFFFKDLPSKGYVPIIFTSPMCDCTLCSYPASLLQRSLLFYFHFSLSTWLPSWGVIFNLKGDGGEELKGVKIEKGKCFCTLVQCHSGTDPLLLKKEGISLCSEGGKYSVYTRGWLCGLFSDFILVFILLDP